MIIGKEIYVHRKRSDTNFISTAEKNGGTSRTEVGPLCYARAIEGQWVTVQVWKSKIVSFVYPDRTYKTHLNPSVTMDNNSLIYVYGIMIFGSALILFLWLMIRRTLLLQQSRL